MSLLALLESMHGKPMGERVRRAKYAPRYQNRLDPVDDGPNDTTALLLTSHDGYLAMGNGCFLRRSIA